MKNFNLFIVLVLGILSSVMKAQAQLGNGLDPSPSSVTTTYTDDTRARVTSIGASSGGSVTLNIDHSVGTWRGAVSGVPVQKVLIILMAQTGLPPYPTRNWQIADLQIAGSGSLTVSNFAHTNWCTSSSPTCKIQVIRVPQYSNVTLNTGGVLTCSPWDGYTGGVVCFLANGTLTFNTGGKIDVSAKGFSNANTQGQGGIGASAPAAPALNGGMPAAQGNNGNRIVFPFFSKGQCVSPATSGGNSGTGGFKTPGSSGVAGDLPETRQSLPQPLPPKLLFLGKGGKKGDGGKGGDAGGSGSNGGNGGMPATLAGGTGVSGTNGGNGGNGGTGGGIIIVLAGNVSVPSMGKYIDISGTPGNAGLTALPTFSPATGGNGSNGGNATPCIGYGAGGIKGQRGDGAAGGSGGGGGSIGSFSIRVLAGGINNLAKTHVIYNAGAGGAGGSGQNPPSAPGVDGQDGCPETIMCGATVCTKKVYTPYRCACYEAYRVLGDMDVATDYGSYIKYTRSAASGPVYSKKNPSIMISKNPADYYCLYYKCSKLLMAFEDAGTPITPVMRPKCTPPNNPITIYNEQKANLYWCKLADDPCSACDVMHSGYYADIMSMRSSIISNTTTGSVTDASTSLTHNFGWTRFGNNGITASPDWRFQYADIGSLAIAGNGQLTDQLNPGLICKKACEPFRMEWIDLYSYYPCSCPAAGGGTGGTSGGPQPSLEVYPDLPYIPALWDNPKKGDDGTPGEPGEADDSYFESGNFTGGEDGLSELVGINELSAAGKFFAVAPNPTGNQLSVLVTDAGNMDKVDIKILDITGKLVFEKQACSVTNKVIVQDISRLQPGTYFISITGTQTSEILKFVKQ